MDALLERLLDGSGPLDDIAVVAARLVPAPLELDLPADPAQLHRLRRAVALWGAEAGVPVRAVDDLLLAVGEAAANAVEHAYPAGSDPGRVRVTLERDGSTVTGTVRDSGAWRPAPADPGFRGRGLQIVRGLADDVVVRARPDGTTVRFRLRLPALPSSSSRPPVPDRGPRPASVQISATPDGPCVQLLGDLDLAGVAEVRGDLLGALAGGGAVLDLSGVDSLSSVGLALVLEAVETAGGRAAVDVVLPATGPARRALELTGLIPLLLPEA